MTIDIYFKQMSSSPSLRTLAETKVRRLDLYFDEPARAHWEFHHDRRDCVAHCRVVGRIRGREIDLSGGAATEDFGKAIDLTISRLRRQIRKRKEVAKGYLHDHSGVPMPGV